MVQSFITDKLEAIAELCRTHHVKRLAVFGSAARDDFDPERSDVDLLVEFGVPEEVRYAKNFFSLQRSMTTLLDRRVDVVIAGTLRNPVVLRNVDEDVETLYAA